MRIKKVKEIEVLRRKIENNEENKLVDVSDFYEMDLYNEDDDVNVLFLLRIFWCLMKDLDNEKKGYDVKEWNFKNYYKFFIDNVDKVDLNSKSYKMYFKDLVKDYVKNLELSISKINK